MLKVLCADRGLLEILKIVLEEKLFTPEHMKSDIGNIRIKYILSYLLTIPFYSVVSLVWIWEGLTEKGAYSKFLLEKEVLWERGA